MALVAVVGPWRSCAGSRIRVVESKCPGSTPEDKVFDSKIERGLGSTIVQCRHLGNQDTVCKEHAVRLILSGLFVWRRSVGKCPRLDTESQVSPRSSIEPSNAHCLSQTDTCRRCIQYFRFVISLMGCNAVSTALERWRRTGALIAYPISLLPKARSMAAPRSSTSLLCLGMLSASALGAGASIKL